MNNQDLDKLINSLEKFTESWDKYEEHHEKLREKAKESLLYVLAFIITVRENNEK